MKKPIKPIAYFCEVYMANVFFYEATSPEETARSLRCYFNIDIDEQSFRGYDGKAIEILEQGSYIIWIKNKKEKAIPDLAHEALHTCNSILHARGIPLTIENDETQAYLLSWLMKCLLSNTKRRRY
jgi:hypothetical protein